jgi:hypothetical protein
MAGVFMAVAVAASPASSGAAGSSKVSGFLSLAGIFTSLKTLGSATASPEQKLGDALSGSSGSSAVLKSYTATEGPLNSALEHMLGEWQALPPTASNSALYKDAQPSIALIPLTNEKLLHIGASGSAAAGILSLVKASTNVRNDLRSLGKVKSGKKWANGFYKDEAAFVQDANAVGVALQS